jgi:hypothetical protein
VQSGAMKLVPGAMYRAQRANVSSTTVVGSAAQIFPNHTWRTATASPGAQVASVLLTALYVTVAQARALRYALLCAQPSTMALSFASTAGAIPSTRTSFRRTVAPLQSKAVSPDA